jgi:hypothetical protein
MVRGGAAHSTILSSSLREARRAGEKTTISTPNDSARQAQNIAWGLSVAGGTRGTSESFNVAHQQLQKSSPVHDEGPFEE